MQIKKEEFIHHEDVHYDVYNRFQANGLSEYDKNTYDECDRIVLKKSVEDGRGLDGNTEYYEWRYQYEDLVTRIFKYKTGYSTFDSQTPRWDEYNQKMDSTAIVFPLNELVQIEEIIYLGNGNLLLNKLTDLRLNLISEKKYSYDDIGNLIQEVEVVNNQIISEINSLYEKKLKTFISDGIYKTYFKFSDEKKLVEVNVYELKENKEVLYGKICFEYADSLCEKLSFEILGDKYVSNEDFNFYDYLLDLFENHLYEQANLPYAGYYINSNKYLYLKKFEIVFDYYDNYDLKQMTLYADNVDKFIERRFYVYEYKASLREYVAGFGVKDDEIEHVFSHKFSYYE